MTPELAELLLDKLPELIIAVGVLVTSNASVMAARRVIAKQAAADVRSAMGEQTRREGGRHNQKDAGAK